MSKKYIMALDQGTTSSRCILFDQAGAPCSISQREFEQIFPQPGWVEHNPMDIWVSQISVAAEAMSRIGISHEDIEAIGITNQRETTIVWDKMTGEPVGNAIVWQCRRTAPLVDQLVRDGYSDLIRERTGLIPDAYFSGTKLKWILDHHERARERARKGELLFGTVDSWLIWKLTGGSVHITDVTNASRTMLFDIHRLKWDDEILSLLDIPKEMLPEVKPSGSLFGTTRNCPIGDGIPIAGAAGDQQAALFGQCCFEEGDAKNTYGTGCFLLMNTGNTPITSRNGLLTTIAASPEGTKTQYALEGSVFVAGAAIQWLRDELGLIQTAAQTEECCRMVPDTNDVYVVPAFTGLGAPYWDQYARGAIVGLSRGATRNHIIRATVESLAYQTGEVLRAMEADSNIRLKALRVDGGASANNFLMQFQSDLLNVRVLRPSCIETTALGAAALAGLTVGFWETLSQFRDIWSLQSQFDPQMQEDKRQKLWRGWEKAVKRAFEWEDH